MVIDRGGRSPGSQLAASSDASKGVVKTAAWLRASATSCRDFFHEARLIGWDHCLDPISHSKLHQHSGHVCLDRVVTNNQVTGDSALDLPLAISLSTSSSRAVRSRMDWDVAGGAGRWRAKRSTSRRVTEGASSAPDPRATWRMASTNCSAGRSLRRNPVAASARAALRRGRRLAPMTLTRSEPGRRCRSSRGRTRSPAGPCRSRTSPCPALAWARPPRRQAPSRVRRRR